MMPRGHTHRVTITAVIAFMCASALAANEPEPAKRPGAATVPAPAPFHPAIQPNSPAMQGAVAPGASTQLVELPDKLVVENSAGVFTCGAPLTATLRTAAGTPVPGASVSFTVGGVFAGTAVTNAGGVAAINFNTPMSLATGANKIAATTVSNHQTISAGADFDAVRPITALAVTVVDPLNHVVSSSSEIIEEERQITLRGALFATQSCVQQSPAPAQVIAFSVNGKQVGTASTNSAGQAALAWTIPKGTVATDLVAAEFDGSSHYLAATGANTVSFQIKHKPKLPPAVINAPGMSAVGVF